MLNSVLTAAATVNTYDVHIKYAHGSYVLVLLYIISYNSHTLYVHGSYVLVLLYLISHLFWWNTNAAKFVSTWNERGQLFGHIPAAGTWLFNQITHANGDNPILWNEWDDCYDRLRNHSIYKYMYQTPIIWVKL